VTRVSVGFESMLSRSLSFRLLLIHFVKFATEPSTDECRKEADVVFVVDSSSNLLYEAFQMYVLGTITDIIRRLDVDSGRTRVAAVQFSNTAKVCSICTDFVTSRIIEVYNARL